MKIAIVRLSALGDIVQTSIVLQFIKKYYENAQIDWVCEERFSNILENCKLINKVIKINLKNKQFIKSYKILKNARKNSYDLAIDFQGLIKSALVAKLICKNVAGFDKNSIRESFASYFYTKKIYSPYEENVIIRYLTLASKTLNFSFSKDEILDKSPCFTINSKNEKKDILIIIGSSQNAKIYDVNLQVELINILKNKGYEIYISYGKGEENLADFISNKTEVKKISNLSLKDLCNEISNFKLVIGPDAGPTHLAWALNVKSITIFGYTPYYRNTYQTDINLTIHSGKKIDAKNLNKNDFCINEIKPNKIANLATRLLNG